MKKTFQNIYTSPAQQSHVLLQSIRGQSPSADLSFFLVPFIPIQPLLVLLGTLVYSQAFEQCEPNLLGHSIEFWLAKRDP